MDKGKTNRARLLRAKGIYDTGKRGYAADTMIIEKGKIAAVGSYEDLRAGYPEAIGEDFSSFYLLPGLINTHVHLEFEAAPNTLDFYTHEDPSINFLRAAVHAEQMLRSGVTTLRDAGSSWRLLPLALGPAAELRPLPRMRFAGPPLTITGGHLHFMGGEADSKDELIKAVREHHKRGCGALKLIVSGGQLTPGTLPERESYDVELIGAAVNEAHHLGMRSFAHCLTSASMVNAMRGGVQSIEHAACFVRNRGNGLLERVYEDSLMAEFRGDGRWFMNGITNNYHNLDSCRENSAEGSEKEKFLLEQEERECGIFRKYVELGLRPVVGTDAGVGLTFFDETWFECAVLVERCGQSPADVIEAATKNGAECLGLGEETGILAPAYSADIIALKEDPLKNIRALKAPAGVICRGEDV
jgi:imidazolonepropionase-like amidohydrolase